jgi:hypothetical protein
MTTKEKRPFPESVSIQLIQTVATVSRLPFPENSQDSRGYINISDRKVIFSDESYAIIYLDNKDRLGFYHSKCLNELTFKMTSNCDSQYEEYQISFECLVCSPGKRLTWRKMQQKSKSSAETRGENSSRSCVAMEVLDDKRDFFENQREYRKLLNEIILDPSRGLKYAIFNGYITLKDYLIYKKILSQFQKDDIK